MTKEEWSSARLTILRRLLVAAGIDLLGAKANAEATAAGDRAGGDGGDAAAASASASVSSGGGVPSGGGVVGGQFGAVAC